MESRIRLRELWKPTRALPIECAAVDQQATDGDPMATEKLGRRVTDEICTEVEGAQQIRRRERAIDQQRQPRGMRNLGDARDVEHIESRVTQGFGEEHSGIGPDRLAPGRQIARINEGRIDTETPQRVIEQVVRPTVERATREHVRTGAREGRDRQMQCRLATGRGDCTHAPIEGRNAFFEHGRSRIGDA